MNIIRRCAAACLFLILTAHAFAQQSPTASLLNIRSGTTLTLIGNEYIFNADNALSNTGGADQRVLVRRVITTSGAVSHMRLVLVNRYGANNIEAVVPGSAIWQAAFEYNGINVPITFQGQLSWTIDPNAPAMYSDLMGIAVPENTQFNVRIEVHVPSPPTGTPTATAVASGGACAAGTYFWKVSGTELGQEGLPSTEFTQTLAANGLATLAWTPPANLPNQSYIVYRTAAGGASGTEKYVATVGPSSTGYQDSCAGQPVSTQVPQTLTVKFPFGGYLQVGESSNTSGNNTTGVYGTGTVATTGTGTINTNAKTTYGPGEFLVVGDDTQHNAVCTLSDSLVWLGFQASSNLRGGSSTTQNWFASGFTLGVHNFGNLGVAGAKAHAFVDDSQSVQTRLAIAGQYCSTIISDLGHNDLYSDLISWQTLASYQLQQAAYWHKRNIKYFVTTLPPSTTSPSNFTAINDQSPSNGAGPEANRKNYNSWVRAGSPVDATGTASLSPIYFPPYVTGEFDLAAPLEADCTTGALLLNGGCWITASKPTLTGQILTGTPTATNFPVGAGTYLNGQYAGQIVVMDGNVTSALKGQTAMIAPGGLATNLTLFANGVVGATGRAAVGLTQAPAAGDTFSIWPNATFEGVHLAFYAHTIAGAAFFNWVATCGCTMP